ncbi:MAG: hypothetical protein KC516_03455 [Nanoarchaeota archaeon]|nr:hypothetical protein [Nanoarchaeota archaeon]
MKKSVIFVTLVFIFLVLSANFVLSELTADQEEEQVGLAYSCLINKIDTTDCSRVSAIESIFSFLSVGKCEDRMMSEAQGENECWPKNNCDLKSTAQAILALDKNGLNSENAENWLISNNDTPTELNWYLEVESNNAVSCSATYGGASYSFSIGEDKKINSNAGSCLTRDSGDYIFRISNQCYDEQFQISCDDDFLTTLLYKKQGLQTVYVLKTTHQASSGGTTIEQINSFCFTNGNSCDYEGSLWAATVLDYKGYDVSSFMPYLIGEAPENTDLLPESFLYLLTNYPEYRSSILQKQIASKYWSASGDKYYDTAFALYPFQYETLTEKTNSKEWLILEEQQEDGCWNNGNILNNAFILHSIWPEYGPNSGNTNNSNGNNTNGTSGNGGILDCEDEGYYCTSTFECGNNGGVIYDEYDCQGLLSCCSEAAPSETCSEMGGTICDSNEWCDGGELLYPLGLDFGEICCGSGGSCEVLTGGTDYDCEVNFGVCEPYGCGEGYSESFEYSCEFGDSCCIQDGGTTTPPASSGKKNLWWIWVLFALIVLAVLGILFKDKLKMFLLKLKSGKKKDSGESGPRGPPGFPPRRPPMPPPRQMQRPPIQRRIIPPSQPRHSIRKPIPKKSSGELDEVLKKLKEMSKE